MVDVRPRRKGGHQLRVVVQHLFKMRDVPRFVDAVPRKPTSDMVVDAASDQGAQGAQGVVPGLLPPGGSEVG